MTAVLSIRGSQGPVVALVEEDTSRMVVVTVHAGTKLDATAAQTNVFLAYDDSSMLEVMSAGMSAAERARLDSEVYAARRQGTASFAPPGPLLLWPHRFSMEKGWPPRSGSWGPGTWTCSRRWSSSWPPPVPERRSGARREVLTNADV